MIYGENKESLIQKYLNTNLNQEQNRYYTSTIVSPLRLTRENNLVDIHSYDKTFANGNMFGSTVHNWTVSDQLKPQNLNPEFDNNILKNDPFGRMAKSIFHNRSTSIKNLKLQNAIKYQYHPIFNQLKSSVSMKQAGNK